MSNIEAIKAILANAIPIEDAQKVIDAVRDERDKALETWSDTQVRTRNLLVGAGLIVGLVIGFVLARVV